MRRFVMLMVAVATAVVTGLVVTAIMAEVAGAVDGMAVTGPGKATLDRTWTTGGHEIGANSQVAGNSALASGGSFSEAKRSFAQVRSQAELGNERGYSSTTNPE